MNNGKYIKNGKKKISKVLIFTEFEPAGVSLVLFFTEAHTMLEKKGFPS